MSFGGVEASGKVWLTFLQSKRQAQKYELQETNKQAVLGVLTG